MEGAGAEDGPEDGVVRYRGKGEGARCPYEGVRQDQGRTPCDAAMNEYTEKDELLHSMLDADEDGHDEAFEIVLQVIQEELARARNQHRSIWRRILAHG